MLLCLLLTACEPGKERFVVAFSEIQNENTVSLDDIFEEATTVAPVQTTAPEPTEIATTVPATTDPPATEIIEEEETAAQTEPESAEDGHYILNTNTKKFHLPSCSSVKTIKDKNKQEYYGDREEVIAQGYKPCKRCNP